MKTSEYNGKKVLITGGLGFIGSNLAHALVASGAEVTILDNMDQLYGGNLFNIESIKDNIEIVLNDVREGSIVRRYIRGKDIVFHLAAQVSHTDSDTMPFEDLAINCKGYLNVLEACKTVNPGAKIVCASSRLVLGKIYENPITELHPAHPLSLYGIHKLTMEHYSAYYNKRHGLRTSVLRITNPYGIRQQMKHYKYSMPGWFMRQAIENKVIPIYGDGSQLRDYIYSEDITEAFLRVGITPTTDGELYNCGLGYSIPFKAMAEAIVKITKSGTIEHRPWPEQYEKEETGNCEMDISKLETAIKWKPAINLQDGLKKMYDYYTKHWDKYVI